VILTPMGFVYPSLKQIKGLSHLNFFISCSFSWWLVVCVDLSDRKVLLTGGWFVQK
jgi:hypothetical protein